MRLDVDRGSAVQQGRVALVEGRVVTDEGAAATLEGVVAYVPGNDGPRAVTPEDGLDYLRGVCFALHGTYLWAEPVGFDP